MAIHTFSALCSAIFGNFIFLHLILISPDVLFVYSTQSSPAFILGLNVKRRILDSYLLTLNTLSKFQGQFTLPFRAMLKTYPLRDIGMCVPIFFVQLNPPFRDHVFFSGHFVANPATNFHTKKREGIWPTCKKKHEHTTVLNKQIRTICVFKCWLDCLLASFEALLSLEKAIDEPTPSWSAVPFLASCRTKTTSVKLCTFLCFSSSHRRNMSGKRIFVVTERCIIWRTKKRPRRTSLPQDHRAALISAQAKGVVVDSMKGDLAEPERFLTADKELQPSSRRVTAACRWCWRSVRRAGPRNLRLLARKPVDGGKGPGEERTGASTTSCSC